MLTGAIFAVIMVAAIWFSPISKWVLAVVIASGSIYESWRLRPQWIALLWSLPYIVLPMMLFGLSPREILLPIIIIVWANDVFAYLFGVAFGKHKLWVRISPKKSWEGFVGGVIAAIACAWTMWYWWFSGAGKPDEWHIMANWLGLGIIIALAAVAGDLFESWLKRNAKVKDSGTIFPGHGGFLDRFDALFFALPAAYVYYIVITFVL